MRRNSFEWAHLTIVSCLLPFYSFSFASWEIFSKFAENFVCNFNNQQNIDAVYTQFLEHAIQHLLNLLVQVPLNLTSKGFEQIILFFLRVKQ